MEEEGGGGDPGEPELEGGGGDAAVGGVAPPLEAATVIASLCPWVQ